jgi:hypothetical protein
MLQAAEIPRSSLGMTPNSRDDTVFSSGKALQPHSPRNYLDRLVDGTSIGPERISPRLIARPAEVSLLASRQSVGVRPSCDSRI